MGTPIDFIFLSVRLFITVDNSYEKQHDRNHDQYVDESTHSI
jgi:hypothetical protein